MTAIDATGTLVWTQPCDEEYRRCIDFAHKAGYLARRSGACIFVQSKAGKDSGRYFSVEFLLYEDELADPAQYIQAMMVTCGYEPYHMAQNDTPED